MKTTGRKEINILDRSNNVFVPCKASLLNEEDKFMRHIPISHEEAILHMLLEGVMKEGIKDFFAPMYEPSLSDDGRICYVRDGKPIIGKSYDWWDVRAKDICPERKTRIGTEKEFICFLGCQIKNLSKVEMTVEEAWNCVCNKAVSIITLKKLFGMQATTMHKLLAETGNGGGYWISGNGIEFPVSLIHYYKKSNVPHMNGNGWIICEK